MVSLEWVQAQHAWNEHLSTSLRERSNDERVFPMTIRIGLIVLTALFAAACSREQPTDEMPPTTTPPTTTPAPTDTPPEMPPAEPSQTPPATEPVPPTTDETVPPP
jgi:hypothetical protein